eukprot:m.233649 g.233649  ORF g.233649 m.233649 type:complete len:237 (-) comp19249_c0_seq1:187-897(-)
MISSARLDGHAGAAGVETTAAQANGRAAVDEGAGPAGAGASQPRPNESTTEYQLRLFQIEYDRVQSCIKELENGTYVGLKEARDNIEKEREERQRWLVVYEGLCERDIEDEYSLELRLLEEAKEADRQALKERIEVQFLQYKAMLEENGTPSMEDIRADLMREDRGVGSTPAKPVPRKRARDRAVGPRRRRKPTTPVNRLTTDQQLLRADEIDDDMRGFLQLTGRIRRPAAQRYES